MRAKTTLYLFAFLLLLSIGCQTRRPSLKPENTAERLVEPPASAYQTPAYPRESMDPSNYPPKPPTAVNRDLFPTSGIGSASVNRMGPYK